MLSVSSRARLATAFAATLVFACADGAPVGPTGTGNGPTWRSVSPRAVELRAIGATVQLAVLDSSGAPTSAAGISWESLDPATASVSASGLVRALANGSARIVAASATHADTVTVRVAQEAARVVFTPAVDTIVVGTSQALAYTVFDANDHPIPNAPIIWSSSNNGVVFVSTDGVAAGLSTGSVILTGSAGKATGTMTMVVIGAPSGPPAPVASVVVSPPTANLTVGQQQQFSATLRDAGGNLLGTRVVTWSTSAPGVATVTAAGVVTAVAAGTATITATSEGKSGTATVTVSKVPVASVTVSPTTATVQVGAATQLSATARDAAGNVLTGRTVTWQSSNTAIANVSATGLVTGVAAGSATITASSEGRSGAATVTVTGGGTGAVVASVTLTPAAATLSIGQTLQMVATARDANGGVISGRTVTWTTSAGGTASISGSGLITAQREGSATITGTIDGVSGTSLVTVAASAAVGTYYVSGTGNDANPGTQAAPFRTIQRAANIVVPGDVVIVDDGVYTDSDANGSIVDVNRGGTAAAPVTFRARNRWGAKLDGQNGFAHEGFDFNNGVGYIRVEGFDIYGVANVGSPRGSASGIDLYDGGHDSWIVGNHIHDIGRVCTTSENTNGQVAIFVQELNVTIEENLIHDIGRFFPGESGCSYSSTFGGYKTLDHGIYLNGSSGSSNGAIIRNNIFYNTRHGWGVQMYPGSHDNVLIANNTFAFSNPNKNYTAIVLDATMSNVRIVNNIFYNPEGGRTMEANGFAGSATVANNLTTAGAMTDVGTPAGMTLSGNLLSTDPLFVNAGAADFHLQAGSPAIDRGQAVEGIVRDFERLARPRGGGFDIGAYER